MAKVQITLTESKPTETGYQARTVVEWDENEVVIKDEERYALEDKWNVMHEAVEVFLTPDHIEQIRALIARKP